MIKNSSIYGAAIGGAYGLGTGLNRANVENTKDLSRVYSGELTEEQYENLKDRRAKNAIAKSLLYGGGGAFVGQGVRKVIGDVGRETTRQLSKAKEEATEAIQTTAKKVDDAIRASAEEYEAMSKRVADHSAAEAAKKAKETVRDAVRQYEEASNRVAEKATSNVSKQVDEKLDRLPRWLGGKKGWFGGNFGSIKEAQFYFFSKEVKGE